VGKLVAVIAAADEDISGIAGPSDGPKPKPAPESKAPEPKAPEPAAQAPTETAKPQPSAAPAPQPGERIKASPLARKVARDRGVDLTVMSGSGPGGRIVKRDLEGAAASSRATHDALRTGPGAFRDIPLSPIRKTIAKRLVQSL